MPETTDVEAGAKVRYKNRPNSRWRHGRVTGLRDDGSIDLTDELSGSARTLPPDRIERFEKGPRGGAHWFPLTTTSAVDDG